MRLWLLFGSFPLAALLGGCVTPGVMEYQRDRYSTASLLLLTRQNHKDGWASYPDRVVEATAPVGSAIAMAERFLTTEVMTVEGTPELEWVDQDSGDRYSIVLNAGQCDVVAFSARDLYCNEQLTTMRQFSKGKLSDEDFVKVSYKLAEDGRLWVVWRELDDNEVRANVVNGAKASIKTERVGPSSEAKVRRELVYTGRSGRQVNLMYREYKDDMARPAFTQQLLYELDTDSLIGFQGGLFKVMSASNTQIVYQVLAPLPP